jgi:hypothetical protein
LFEDRRRGYGAAMGFLDRFRGSSQAATEPDPGAFARLRELALAGAPLDEQRAALAAGLRAHGVSEAAVPAVLAHARDGVRLLEREPRATHAVRVGGPAQLPPDTAWPVDPDGEPFTFIARIDLAAIPHLAPLPDGGTLLIYWSERAFEWEHRDLRAATRVFYLEPGVAPVAAEPPAGAHVPAGVPLLGVVTPILGNRERHEVPDADEEALYLADDALNQVFVGHQLLGTSRDIQGPVLDEVGYWFDRGSPEAKQDYDAAELAGEGWILLAQFGETDDLVFGDVAELYLVIPSADLAARRFDRAVGIMQSH